MTVIRNISIGALWFIFLTGSYVGWAALVVLAELDKTGSYSPADIGWRIGQAVSLGVPLVPLILVGLGFWFGFLPGFKRRPAAGSQA